MPPAAMRCRWSCRCVNVCVDCGAVEGKERYEFVRWACTPLLDPHPKTPPTTPSLPHTHTTKYLHTQLVLCLLILALLLWWVQESLDPRDKPREPFNLCRTHNTVAMLYQFLLTYRYEGERERCVATAVWACVPCEDWVVANAFMVAPLIPSPQSTALSQARVPPRRRRPRASRGHSPATAAVDRLLPLLLGLSGAGHHLHQLCEARLPVVAGHAGVSLSVGGW